MNGRIQRPPRRILHPLLLTLFAGITGCIGTTGSQYVAFEKQVLSTEFFSEGVAVADLNRDGRPDVITGDVWFKAPDWTRHTFGEVRTYDPTTQYSHVFLNFALDVNLDGWIDVIRIGYPGEAATWLENPGARDHDRPWREHLIIESVGNESPRQVDVDADGRLDLLLGDHATGEMIWLRPPDSRGDTEWTRFTIGGPGSPGADRYAHGLGLGDVNGDTRPDVIVTSGWWEAPVNPLQSNPWTFHPAPLGEDAAQMYTMDVDGDGRADILSSSAHNYGIWWHRQDETGWTTHLISDAFSQSHALALEDIDRDGDDDLITGKRFLAHNGLDPGSSEPAVLYWFEFVRKGPDGPRWIPHLVDDDSGVGEHIVVDDIDGDGRADIVVANKKGVFVFKQIRRRES